MAINRNFYQEFKQNAEIQELLLSKDKDRLSKIHDLLVKMVVDFLATQGHKVDESETVLTALMEQSPPLKALVHLVQSGDFIKEVVASAEEHAAQNCWEENCLDTYQPLYDGIEKALNFLKCRQRFIQMLDPLGDCVDSIHDP